MLKGLFCIVFIISRVCVCVSVRASVCVRVCSHIARIIIEKRPFLPLLNLLT